MFRWKKLGLNGLHNKWPQAFAVSSLQRLGRGAAGGLRWSYTYFAIRTVLFATMFVVLVLTLVEEAAFANHRYVCAPDAATPAACAALQGFPDRSALCLAANAAQRNGMAAVGFKPWECTCLAMWPAMLTHWVLLVQVWEWGLWLGMHADATVFYTQLSFFFSSLQSLCLMHTGEPMGMAVSHCRTWFQTQLILTTPPPPTPPRVHPPPPWGGGNATVSYCTGLHNYETSLLELMRASFVLTHCTPQTSQNVP